MKNICKNKNRYSPMAKQWESAQWRPDDEWQADRSDKQHKKWFSVIQKTRLTSFQCEWRPNPTVSWFHFLFCWSAIFFLRLFSSICFHFHRSAITWRCWLETMAVKWMPHPRNARPCAKTTNLMANLLNKPVRVGVHPAPFLCLQHSYY